MMMLLAESPAVSALPGLGTLAFWTPGWPEMLIILVIALLLFGRRLPEVGRSLGKGIVEFRKGVKGIEEELHDASSGRSAASGGASGSGGTGGGSAGGGTTSRGSAVGGAAGQTRALDEGGGVVGEPLRGASAAGQDDADHQQRVSRSDQVD